VRESLKALLKLDLKDLIKNKEFLKICEKLNPTRATIDKFIHRTRAELNKLPRRKEDQLPLTSSDEGMWLNDDDMTAMCTKIEVCLVVISLLGNTADW